MRHLKRTSLVLSGISLLNLLASYLREVIMAMLFGTGIVTDAFIASNGFISAVNDLLFGSMLAACIIPILASLPDNKDHITQWRQAVTSFTVLALTASSAVAVVLYQFLPDIIPMLFPGFDQDRFALTLSFSHILTLLLPLQTILLLFVLTLNARLHYLVPACGYLLINTLFSSLIALFHSTQPPILPWALLAGTAAAVILLALRLSAIGAFGPFRLSHELLAKTWHLVRPMLFSLGLGSSIGLLMVSHLILRHYASYLDAGTVAAMGFAFRIYEVPLTLIVNTAATLAFPAFAAMQATGNRQRLGEVASQMILWGIILLLPVAAVTLLHANAIVTLLLERGHFDKTATAMTAAALCGFAPAILFEAGMVVFFRMFYALHASRIPMLTGIASVLALITLLECFEPQSLQNIAFCLSGAFAVNFIILMLCIRKYLGAGSLPTPSLLLKPIAAALLLYALWAGFAPEAGWPSVASAIGYVVAYAACLWFFLPEQRRGLIQFLRPA